MVTIVILWILAVPAVVIVLPYLAMTRGRFSGTKAPGPVIVRQAPPPAPAPAPPPPPPPPAPKPKPAPAEPVIYMRRWNFLRKKWEADEKAWWDEEFKRLK
jgi:hypothetical protein